MTTAKQATAAGFRQQQWREAQENRESNAVFQALFQYSWKSLARVTFGWNAGDPAKYYRNFLPR